MARSEPGSQPSPIGTGLLFTVATVLAISSTIQSWRLQVLTDMTWNRAEGGFRVFISIPFRTGQPSIGVLEAEVA